MEPLFEPNNFRIGPLQNYDTPITLNNSPMQFSSQPIQNANHMHPLFQQKSDKDCKICKKNIYGGPGYICKDCELIICYDCFQNINYATKFENIHLHPLILRVKPNWKCGCCQKNYSGTASFFCQSCDFDACSKCYLGY